MDAANTYSGFTTVNDGFLLVNNSLALGSTASGTAVFSGAVLALRFGVAVPAEPLTLAGTGQSSFGALSSSFGSNSWAGTITLSSNATISVDAGDFLNLSGAITGGFDITKTGTGTLTFSGSTANNFDRLLVNSGTLELAKSIANAAGPGDITIGDGSGTDIVRLVNDNQIADTTPVHISLFGRFDVNDMLETTGAIDGRGTIDLGSGTLRAGANNGTSRLRVRFSAQAVFLSWAPAPGPLPPTIPIPARPPSAPARWLWTVRNRKAPSPLVAPPPWKARAPWATLLSSAASPPVPVRGS